MLFRTMLFAVPFRPIDLPPTVREKLPFLLRNSCLNVVLASLCRQTYSGKVPREVYSVSSQAAWTLPSTKPHLAAKPWFSPIVPPARRPCWPPSPRKCPPTSTALSRERTRLRTLRKSMRAQNKKIASRGSRHPSPTLFRLRQSGGLLLKHLNCSWHRRSSKYPWYTR